MIATQQIRFFVGQRTRRADSGLDQNTCPVKAGEYMQKDKKNTAENINLVLLKKIGQVSLDKVYTKKILNKFFE